MAYASLADLYTRFSEREIVQLTDGEQTGAPDMATLDRVISDASAEIDAALVGRYALPIDPVPELLTRICCDLVRKSLYTDVVPDVVAANAKNARDLVSGLASGKYRLENAAPATGGATQSDARIARRRHRMRWPGDRR